MLEKQKIIKMWHYNKEHNITDFIFPLAWDVMFNQMFISSDTMPLIEYIVSTIEDTTKQNFKGKVKLLPKDLPQHSIIDTNSKSDLLLSYPNGKKETKCILEMNSSHIMVMRNAFYAYKIASSGLKIKNGAYKKIFDTIVVNFNSYHHKSERLVEIGIFQTDFGKIIEDSIKIINVNIDKALNKRYTYFNEQEEKMARICRILTTCDIKVLERELNEIMSKEETKKIVARAKELSSDDEYIRLFENGEEDNYKELIRNTELAEAREEAEERGLEKGIKKGIKQGIKQGIEKGIIQGSKAATIDLTKNAINIGLDAKTISKLTGLSIKEIESLK